MLLFDGKNMSNVRSYMYISILVKAFEVAYPEKLFEVLVRNKRKENKCL